MLVLASRRSCLQVIFLLLWLCPLIAYAVEVKHAEMALVGQAFVLSADLDYQLNGKAKAALQSGVPLYWDIKIKVEQQREYLWDKTIAEKTIRFRVQYNALLNVYRVRNENSGNSYSFSTLAAALNLMSTLRNYSIMAVDAIQPDKNYMAAIKIKLDRDALPLPLRPVAYTDSQWYLFSDWYVWPLKK